MGKETVNIVDKYLQVLDKLAKSLVKNKPIRTFIINNKSKVVVIFFLLLTILTMYTIWNRGECLNCEVLTASEVEEWSSSDNGDIVWHEYYSNKHYVAYSTLETYLKDVTVPLLITWLQGFIALSLIYLGYRAYTVLMKSLGLVATKLYKPPTLKDQ